jgi:hypothetical protein
MMESVNPRGEEAVLGALVAFDLGVLECRPVGLAVAKAGDIFFGDLLQRQVDQLGWPGMAGNCHVLLLSCRAITAPARDLTRR